MDTLALLIQEQKRDSQSYKIKSFVENETLIRPHKNRFQNFPGETPKQKAFSVLKYLGWTNHNILSALSLSISEILYMQSILNTTTKEELRTQFFDMIPLSLPKHKAIIILSGLHWKKQDIADALSIKNRCTIWRIEKTIKKVMKSAGKRLCNP